MFESCRILLIYLAQFMNVESLSLIDVHMTGLVIESSSTLDVSYVATLKRVSVTNSSFSGLFTRSKGLSLVDSDFKNVSALSMSNSRIFLGHMFNACNITARNSSFFNISTGLFSTGQCEGAATIKLDSISANAVDTCDSSLNGAIVLDDTSGTTQIQGSNFTDVCAIRGAIYYSTKPKFTIEISSDTKLTRVYDKCGYIAASAPVKILTQFHSLSPLPLAQNFSVTVYLHDAFDHIVCRDFDPSIHTVITLKIPNSTYSTEIWIPLVEGASERDFPATPLIPDQEYRCEVAWGPFTTFYNLTTDSKCGGQNKVMVS